jgi:hypothetical protein
VPSAEGVPDDVVRLLEPAVEEASPAPTDVKPEHVVPAAYADRGSARRAAAAVARGGSEATEQAVRRALGRVNEDAIETSWQDAEVSGAPSDPLPSDPDWAGRTVFTDKRSVATRASVAELWRVILGIGGENGCDLIGG